MVVDVEFLNQNTP